MPIPGIRVQTYFKPARLKAAVDRQKMKVFRIAGARTRLIARRKIRKRTKNYVPEPGKPPRVRDTKSSKYRRGILWNYDRSTDSMVVGPAAMEGENTAWVFETGGTIPIDVPDKERGRRRVNATFDKFPVMGPTAKDAQPYYAGIYSQVRLY